MKRDANTKYGQQEPGHFEILDGLPAIIRRALADADYHWQVEWVHDYYTRTRSVADTIAVIRRADVEQHAKVARRERRTVFDKRGRPIPMKNTIL